MVRTYDLGEADQIIVLLTRHHGIVRGVAKGVRRTRSRFGARLDRFCLVDVLIYPGRNRSKPDGGLAVLSDAAAVRTYAPAIVADVDKFYAGVAMLEITELVVRGDDSDAETVLELLDAALGDLAASTKPGTGPGTGRSTAPDATGTLPQTVSGSGTLTTLLPAVTQADRLVLEVLTATGWAPSLVDCAQCGAPGPHRAFHPGAGGAVCVRCRPPGAVEPDPAAVRVLWLLSHGRESAVAEIAASPDGGGILREAHSLLLAHTRYQTENGCRGYAAL